MRAFSDGWLLAARRTPGSEQRKGNRSVDSARELQLERELMQLLQPFRAFYSILLLIDALYSLSPFLSRVLLLPLLQLKSEVARKVKTTFVVNDFEGLFFPSSYLVWVQLFFVL